MAVLIQIDAWDPFAGAIVTLCAANHDDERVCMLNGATWWPAVSKAPSLAYDLFDGAFQGQITAPATSFSLITEAWPAFGRYMIADARVRVWTGAIGAAWADYTLRFDGRASGQPKLADGVASIDIAVDDRWLDAPLLATYAGTGGEGGQDLAGQVKPLALGAPRYVAGTLIDATNSVFQLSAYGVVQGFEAALEKLARFGPAAADYPSYAALVGAAIPAGRWATCKAAGCARFGAPPAGQISFLLQGDAAGPNGWARRPGQLIRRLALLSGGAGRIADASLDALDAARPYNLSVVVEAQTTARELVQTIAASVDAVAGVSWTGQLFVVPVAIGAPAATLRADGITLPPVASVAQASMGPPWWRLAIQAVRCWTVHALGDIAFTATLTPMGDWNAATTYREGAIVQYQGASWLYINPTPTSGHAPPGAPSTGDDYWKSLAQSGADGTDGTNGTDGAAGQDALAIAASPSALIVSCDSAGGPKSGQFAKTAQLQLLLGSADVTGSAGYAIATSSCTANVNPAGLVTFSDMSADHGYADITASYGGASIVQRVTIDKVRDGATQAAPSNPPVTLSLGTTNYPTPVVLDAGQTVTISADVNCRAGSAQGSGQLKIQISPSGAGTWSDVATSSGSAVYTPSEPLDLFASGTFTNSGGPRMAFDVRVVVTTNGGSPGAVNKAGSFLTFGF